MGRPGLHFYKVRRKDKIVEEGEELSLFSLQSKKIVKGTPNTFAIKIKKKDGVIKVNLGVSNLKEDESGLRTNKKWKLFLIPKECGENGTVSVGRNSKGDFFPIFSS